MSFKNKAIAAGAVVAACAAGGAWYFHHQQSTSASLDGATADSTSTAGPGSERYRPHPWKTGEEHTYEIEIDTETTVGGGTLISYALKGDWVLRITGVYGQRIDFQASIRKAEFDAKGQSVGPDAEAQLARAKEEFARPFGFSMDAKGVLHTVSDSDRTELQVRSFARNVASLMQVVQPLEGDSWEAEERDNAGQYKAAYMRTAEDALVKRKVEYLDLGDAAKQSDHSLQVAASNWSIALRPRDGLPLEIVGEEKIRAQGNTLGGAVTTTKARLVFAGTERPRKPVADLSGHRATPPNVYARQGSYTPETDHARIGGRNFTDTVRELGAVLKLPKPLSEEDKRRERRSFIALAAMFRQRPEDVEMASSMLRAGENLQGALWDALGSAGSPEAQAALIDSIGMDQWTDNERTRQMIALSFAEVPTPETVEFLQTMASDPKQHQQARYGLGTAANHLVKSDPARAGAIVDDLRERLSTAPGPADRRELITGLGNSGHQGATEAILAELDSGSTVMRVEALDALRLLPGADASRAIARHMTQDQDPSVRMAAVDTARSRAPDEVVAQGLLQAWTKDPDAKIRKAAGSAIEWIESNHPGFQQHMEQARASL